MGIVEVSGLQFRDWILEMGDWLFGLPNSELWSAKTLARDQQLLCYDSYSYSYYDSYCHY